MWEASDLNGLLLLYSSYGDADGYAKVAAKAQEKGKYNVAFICLFLLGRLDDCIGLLCLANRIPEAAFLARTYAPSRVPEVVNLWKQGTHTNITDTNNQTQRLVYRVGQVQPKASRVLG